MSKIRLKTNDQVLVLSGKDKGKKGKILQVLRQDDLVVVEGVNTMYKYMRRQRKNETGQRIEFFGPIHVSKVKKLASEATIKPVTETAPDKK
ncbi:MAG: 50S ribosomal protein L24 [Candidatus Komeilibacteria bacterium]